MKKRAEKWFDEFQRSSVAWTSILGVLQNQSCPTEARHLCSIGLRNKCLLDLEELPKEHVSQVRESIISLLLAPQPLSTPIRTTWSRRGDPAASLFSSRPPGSPAAVAPRRPRQELAESHRPPGVPHRSYRPRRESAQAT